MRGICARGIQGDPLRLVLLIPAGNEAAPLAALSSVTGDELIAVEVRGPAAGSCLLLNSRYASRTAGPLWQVFSNRAPILIDNIHGTSAETSFQAMLGEDYKVIAPYVRSWIGVPLIYKEEPLGILSLASAEP